MDSNLEARILGDSGTLSPLPKIVKEGVLITGILGLFSFVSCGVLFIYISYRLKLRRSSRNDAIRASSLVSEQEDDSKLSLPGSRSQSTSDGKTISAYDSGTRTGEYYESKKSESNPFLTLIHNLLVADMLQALAFALGLNWWRVDGIFVPSGSCGAQSFLIMIGSVSISVFLIAISINTLLTIVWGLKLSRLVVRYVVIFNWLFSFALAFAGLGINLMHKGGQIYGRSIAVCWVAHEHAQTFGLWLQNFWLFAAIALTIVAYAWILVVLTRNKQSPKYMPPNPRKNTAPELSGHHPAFLVYPVIYLATTIPVALVGLLSAAHSINVQPKHFNLVIGITSLAGLLDAILWSTTILLSSSKELKETGLDPFEFLRSPSRDYGNIVWVEGAAGIQTEQRKGSRGHIRWRLNGGRYSLPKVNEDRIVDDFALNEIHMDTITSVQVEHSLTEPKEPDNPFTSKVPKAYHPKW